MQPLITSAVIVLILLKEFSVLWWLAADYSLHHATEDEKERTAICRFALNKNPITATLYLYAFIMYTAAFTRAYVLNAHACVYSTSHDWSIPLPRNSLVTGGWLAKRKRVCRDGQTAVRGLEMEVRPGNKARNRNVNYIKMNRRSDWSKLSCVGAGRSQQQMRNPIFQVRSRQTAISPLKKTFLRTDLLPNQIKTFRTRDTDGDEI